MKEHYLYLSINFFSVIVPFISSFHPRVRFYKEWTTLALSILIIGLLFVVWDVVFTAIGVWGFNSRYVCGVYLAGLPLEELLFFICIPYCCVFSYHCFGLFWPLFVLSPGFVKAIAAGLIALCVSGVVVFYDRAYTSVTLSLCILLLFATGFNTSSAGWMGRLIATYTIMLFPMLIVNGFLTGAYTTEPVVWYNADEMTGWRINHIPAEDFIYGFLLVGSVTAVYEKLKDAGM